MVMFLHVGCFLSVLPETNWWCDFIFCCWCSAFIGSVLSLLVVLCLFVGGFIMLEYVSQKKHPWDLPKEWQRHSDFNHGPKEKEAK